MVIECKKDEASVGQKQQGGGEEGAGGREEGDEIEVSKP